MESLYDGRGSITLSYLTTSHAMKRLWLLHRIKIIKRVVMGSTLSVLDNSVPPTCKVDCVTDPFWTVTVDIALDSLQTHTGIQTRH